jgi:hypothetical protein
LAQLPVVPLQVYTPPVAGGNIVQQSIHLAYYWDSTDLTNNVTITNWTDRIQGVIATQPDSTKRNTNSSKGLRLGAAVAASRAYNLTNNLVNISPESSSIITNMVLFCVCQWDGSLDQFSCQALFDDYANGNDAQGAASLYLRNADNNRGYCLGKYTDSPFTAKSPFTANQTTTLICQIPTNGATWITYTNGTLETGGNNSHAGFTNITTFGATNVGSTYHPMLGWLGVVAIGTNTVLTATSVSNLNWYGTNTFK